MLSCPRSAIIAVSGALALLVGPAPAIGVPHSGTAAAGLSVRLSVSDSHPKQLHGTSLQAVASEPAVLLYYFQYGDGTAETSAQPLASHGYMRAGTFYAKVSVLAVDGDTATSAPVTIHVRDGIPPTVRISSPRAGARVRLGSGGLLLAGRASDAGGIARVQLAIQLVASAIHYHRHGGCIWYDGRTGLVLASCQAPHFFAASHARDGWRAQIGPHASIPAGTYVVRVRAADRAGNVSSAYAERLGTIIPFRLRR